MKITKMIAILSALTLLAACTGCAAQESSTAQNADTAALVSIGKPEVEELSETVAEPAAAADYAETIFGQDVIEINIETTADDWDYLMENAQSKPWISGNITINGETLSNVGIKTKGNTSLNQLPEGSERYSLKLNFGKYEDGQTCHGLDKLALNNLYADATYLKEYMSYDLFRYMDVPASLCTFAKITVNGEYYGFFIVIEDTDDSFIERNYGEESDVKAYKPESMDMGGMGKNGKPDFGDMPEGFDPENMQMPEGMELPEDFDPENMPDMGGKDKRQRFGQRGDSENGEHPEMPEGFDFDPDKMQMPEDFDPENFDPENMPEMGGGFGGMMNGGRGGVSLVYSDDDPESYANIFDNNLTKTTEEDETRLIASLKGISEDDLSYINVDEVLRYTACNVFLVNLDSYFSSMAHNYVLTEDSGVLSMIPWDYNLAFGSFQGQSADSVINYAIDTVFNGVSAEDRPIIGKLLEDEENLAKYHEYLRQIAEEYIGSGYFAETIDRLNSVIGEYVQNDTTSFDSYESYTAGIEMLKLYGELRAESILGQLDGSIPSTTETQKDSGALIDASALDMTKLGKMSMDKRIQRG